MQLKCIGELVQSELPSAAARPAHSYPQSGSSIAAYYMEQLRHQEQELVICMMSDVTSRHHLGNDIDPDPGNGATAYAGHAKGGLPGGPAPPCSQSDP